MITVLLYSGHDLTGDLIRWGEGGDPNAIVHVAYSLADGWVLSAGASGLLAYPSERFPVSGATLAWAPPLTDTETAAWVAALRQTVGKPYGWRAFALDGLERLDYTLSAHLAAATPPGLVCSSEGAVTLATAAPARYQALFGDRLPALVRPVDWATAMQAAMVAGKAA